MSDVTEPTWRWQGVRTVVSIVLLILLLMIILALTGAIDRLPLVHEIIFGWMFFLVDAWERRSLTSQTVITLLWCVPLLALGLHGAMRWLYGEWQRACNVESSTPWQPRWTLKLLMLAIVLVVAGLVVWGAVDQIIWLATTNETIVNPGGPSRFNLIGSAVTTTP